MKKLLSILLAGLMLAGCGQATDSGTAEEVAKLMYEIEAAARMKHTAIVNNTNLGCETTLDIIEQSRPFAEETARITGLPVKYTVYPEELVKPSDKSDVFPAKVYVKPVWGLTQNA